MTSAAETLELAWAQVFGQTDAIHDLQAAAPRPVHAYLFTGPAGSGKRAAARAFAAAVVNPDNASDDRAVRLALAGEHPDVVEIERVGASILKAQALDIVRMAAMSPVEGRRKVLVLHEFHLLSAEGAAVLLKTIEEPAASTVIVILADQLPPELVTIASRCVRIRFRPLLDADVVTALIVDGVDRATAERVAAGANGNVERARLLANDAGLEARRQAFAAVPERLDGSGHRVAVTVRELLELIDAAAAPVKERHEAEVTALDERAKQHGERGSGRKALEERHRRELRRHRTDELRAGLTEIARTYRDRLASDGSVSLQRADAMVSAVHSIHGAIEALDRNPNEPLLLQGLLLRLPH